MGRCEGIVYDRTKMYPKARENVKQSICYILDKDEFVLSLLGEERIMQNIIMGLKTLGYDIDDNCKIRKYKNKIELVNKKDKLLLTRDNVTLTYKRKNSNKENLDDILYKCNTK